MRILMVGGTRFVGRHIALAALDAGHELTVFHRGRTGGDLFADRSEVDVRRGDRDSDLSALAAGSWDATIDTCAYVPRQVNQLADVLGDRAGHYLQISSVSAYGLPEHPGVTEDAALATLDDPTVEEVTGETYGGLKALCEQAAHERFGSSAIVRPTYVVGPDDYTWRFPWWVQRIAAGGEVLAPEPADAPAQIIDVRDMANWIVRLVASRTTGAFHAVSPAPVVTDGGLRWFTWADLLEAVRSAVAPAGTSLVWIGKDFLLGEGVTDQELPMWSGPEPDGYALAADPAKAYTAGLSPRPLADTVRDTLAWTRAEPMPAGTGLEPAREQDLLRGWRELG
jgi:2'-hydroxyisoflavone reductase